MYYFVEIACVIAEIWTIHTFLSSFFEKKLERSWIMLPIYLIFGICVTILSLIEDLASLRMIFALVGVWAISMVIFRARLLRGLITSIVFCAIVAVADIITALGLQLFGIDIDAMMQQDMTRAMYLIVDHIFLFGFIMLICLVNRMSPRQMSIRILLPIAPCWLISILLGFLLTWQCFKMDYQLHPLFLVVLLGLLYTSIIVIYYTNRVNEQAQLKKDLEIAEHHYAMQQEYYDQLRAQQEETRALWHDISKYLRASQAEASTDALNQVQELLDATSRVVDVDNRVVSVILNEYYQACNTAGIAMVLDVQVPQELFVTAADLYVLIGNTLDNAIEACQELPEDQRKISVKLKVHNGILFYEVENPYVEKHLHRIRGHYHGFGLKNASRCIEKYQGHLETNKENGIYQVKAYLNSI